MTGGGRCKHGVPVSDQYCIECHALPKRPGREGSLKVSVMHAAAKYAPRLLIRKTHGSRYGVKGDPDVVGSYGGRAFAIELKRRGEAPTRLQEQRLKEWALAGAITGCAHSAAEFLKLLGI